MTKTTTRTEIEIRNTFHNTVVRVRPGPGGILSRHQMRRIRRTLCGMTDCRCWHYEAEDGWEITEVWDSRQDDYTWAVVPGVEVGA